MDVEWAVSSSLRVVVQLNSEHKSSSYRSSFLISPLHNVL